MSYSPNADHLEHWATRIRKDEISLFKAKDQIERLLEVGDEMALVLSHILPSQSQLLERWTAAKEAKP
jgi:hypothetical protein